MKHLLISIALLFVLADLFAHAVLYSGKIVDKDGAPVAYATIYVRELTSGFITDDNGLFQTYLSAGSYTFEISCLGYVPVKQQVNLGSQNVTQEIVLEERVYQLQEVHITKGLEDPAYAVMRKAIAYAPYYRNRIAGFTAETYLKGSGKVDGVPAVLKLSKEFREESKKLVGKLFVIESHNEVRFTAPNHWHNHILAYRNSFPKEMEMDEGITFFSLNLYEPEIFGKINPVSAGSFSYYRFKLEECYAQGNYLVNKIKVTPKRNNPKLVSGYLYIIEDLWCIADAEVSIKNTGIHMDIHIACKEFSPGVFVTTSMVVNCDIGIMGLKAKASYASSVRYKEVKTNDQVNGLKVGQTVVVSPPEPTEEQKKIDRKLEKLVQKEKFTTRDAYRMVKLMEKSDQLKDSVQPEHRFQRAEPKRGSSKETRDSLAGKQDSLYWTTIRSIPLLVEEERSYETKKLEMERPEPLRSTSSDSKEKAGKNRQWWNTVYNGKTYRFRDKTIRVTTPALKGVLKDYNFVDGLWLGGRMGASAQLNNGTVMRLEPSVYYTTARKNVVSVNELSLTYLPLRRGRLVVAGGTVSEDFNSESGEKRWINAFSSLLFARNEMKLYDKRYFTASNRIEVANGLQLFTLASWERRKSLDNAVHHSLFRKKAKINIPDNRDYSPMSGNETFYVSVEVEYTPAHYYRLERGRKRYEEPRWPVLTFRYDKAFPLSGKHSPVYHRTELSVKQKVEFGMFNKLHWWVNGGGFWNKKRMLLPDFKHFASTTFQFTEREMDKGFSLLNNYEYATASRWIQGNVMWNAPYVLFKHLPFLQRHKIDEALHLRSLLVAHRNPYYEVGYSVGYLKYIRGGIFVGMEKNRYKSAGFSLSVPLGSFR